MNEELLKLIELARPGQPDPFQRLAETLRERSAGEPGLLVEFARSGEELLRRAAITAARGRTQSEVLQAIAELARDPLPAVRQSLAYALTDDPSWPLDAAAEVLLADPDVNVRQASVWCACMRRSLLPALLRRFHVEDNTWVRSEIAYALKEAPSREALPELLARLAADGDAGVQQGCAVAAEKQLNSLRGYPADLPRPDTTALGEIRRRLGNLPQGAYPVLSAWLNQELAAHVDVEQLATFGTVLTLEAERGRLARAHRVDEAIDAIVSVLYGPAPRAVVLLGESGSGKTAVVGELVHRLRHGPEPWCVLRISPTDFMRNTRYLGEWETRVHNIAAAVKAPRRVLLYIPNLEELAWMGTWEKSQASVASALAPYIERGDLTILGESTAEAFRKGLGGERSLRRLFHAIDLPAADARRTREILQRVADEAAAEVPEAILDRLGDLAEFFVAGAVEPGRSVGLLRRVLGITAGRPGMISEQDILATISQSTGVPVDFLDDARALDRTKVRAFFEARVMGQPEAVDAVVDLVTLIKAGLNDPNKPYGVLLFVGPTGVGKTELARALAEHLFGDPARLVRLDMSEFASYEAFERLIGQGWRATEPGLLTAAVRERPFAVLLFDEIEKAHPNIYNLCLQIFDAGRLTDTQGRTADFRRTIIILTSNVGSSVPSEGGVGFGRKAPGAPDRELTLRELGRWFRPEFLNRIDRVVSFRPLGVETAEKIARREVARVLERSGIARRKLTVDVAPEVLPLLLREGYSATFGARPLKRTVERMVLLPVARAIAEGQVPAASLLRLVARAGRVDIEVSPPEPAEPAEAAPAARALPVADRAAALLTRIETMEVQAAPLAARKSELLALSAAPGFWDEPVASRRLLDEIYRLDNVLAWLEELHKHARAEVEKAAYHRSSERALARVDERLDDLQGQAEQLAFLVASREPRDLGDAIVSLRRVNAQGEDLGAVEMLAKMYVAFAARRRLEVEVLDDRQGGEPDEDAITLLVSGAGAYALLAGESGMHQLTRGMKEASGGRRRFAERETVRVEVLPLPAGATEFPTGEVRVEVQRLDGAPGRLLGRRKLDVLLFHAPSMTSVRAWSDGSRAEAVSRLQVLLRARLDAAAVVAGETRPPVVRRYRLGPTTLVKDQRSGRHTARLDHVLEGHLDSFLTLPGAGR